MTFDHLSDQAREIAAQVSTGAVDLSDLITAYDRWRSDTSPDASTADDGGIAAGVRRRLGFVSEGAGTFEAMGDALRSLVGGDEGARQQWHDAKIRVLEGGDREKMLLAIGHLDDHDFDDELVIAALIEALSSDDETLALSFAMTAAAHLDPDRRSDVVDLLLESIENGEKRRTSRSAMFGAALEQMFDQHAEAASATRVIERWTNILRQSEDPASYAAAVDLASLTIHRRRDPKMLVEWLAGEDRWDLHFAAAVLTALALPTLQDDSRHAVCDALRVALERNDVTDGGAWLQKVFIEQLARCD